MTMELAVRCAEVLLGFALLQQSLEFLRGYGLEKKLAMVRAPMAILLMFGIYPVWAEAVLLATSFLLVKRFHGPYNGGSDTMSILVLLCLWIANLAPSRMGQEIALGYLALQLMLSYFQAGWVKFENPAWRSGKALREVFAYTAYPVSESVRSLIIKPYLLFILSWVVIIGELLFPLALLHSTILIIALIFTGISHVVNAVLFGLNRFVWSWLAAYPSLIWLQDRISESSWSF